MARDFKQKTGAKSSSTCNQGYGPSELYKHITQAVKEADSHFKANKAIHVTTNIQITETKCIQSFKRGFVRPERSRTKKHTCPRPHGAGKQAKGLRQPGAKPHKGVHL